LHDSGNVFWASAELDVWLDEALRTWGVAAHYWKDRAVFSTVSGTAFYDLTTVLAPALRAYTVTDTNLVRDIQYHLLEPATGTSWTGSEQFTFAEVSDALERRRNQFLVETGCDLDHFTVNVAGVPDGRVPLADNVIDIRRAAWFDADSSIYNVLWRDDEWGAASFNAEWAQEPDTPSVYSVSVTPPLTVQLVNPPLSSGQLDLVAVRSGATLDPANGVALGVPDDFAWAIKFGALADLLGKDGQAYDPGRSAYCEQRWQDGVALARITASVMRSQIGNRTMSTEALYEMDGFDHKWQNSSGKPSTVMMVGLNLVALADVPNGVYGMSMDVLRNAPIPSGDGDYLEVGREELTAIVHYAQHLASFKMGGEEFQATMPHYERFWRMAALRNGRLKAAARNFAVLRDRAQREEMGRPRVEEVTA
jgi:hypothetical protein